MRLLGPKAAFVLDAEVAGLGVTLVDVVTDEVFVINEQVIVTVAAARVFQRQEAAKIAGDGVEIRFERNIVAGEFGAAVSDKPSRGLVLDSFSEPFDRKRILFGDPVQRDHFTVNIGSGRYVQLVQSFRARFFILLPGIRLDKILSPEVEIRNCQTIANEWIRKTRLARHPLILFDDSIFSFEFLFAGR